MPTIQISDWVYAKLLEKANHRGIGVDEMLAPLLESIARDRSITPPALRTSAERLKIFQEHMEEMRNRPTDLPPGYRADDSRESMYT